MKYIKSKNGIVNCIVCDAEFAESQSDIFLVSDDVQQNWRIVDIDAGIYKNALIEKRIIDSNGNLVNKITVENNDLIYV